MSSQLCRSVQQPLWSGMRVCKASTSKHGFATSSAIRSQDTPPTSSTSSMQKTETQMTPATIIDEKVPDQSAPDGRRKTQRTLSQLPDYKEWIQSGAKQYEYTPRGRGPFWIGDTPYPLNPSFDPPPPIAQTQKQALWKLHQSDPANTVRVLSGKYGISMERLRAILRLQALESEWQSKGKALQEPFQRGMERILGAVERPLGAQLDEQVATEEKASSARGASFEQVPMKSDGEVQPSILANALKEERDARRERRRTLPTGGPASKGPPPTISTVTGAPGRASITIVDMSNRPTSYSGGGVVARNQQRAERRKENRMRRAQEKQVISQSRGAN